MDQSDVSRETTRQTIRNRYIEIIARTQHDEEFCLTPWAKASEFMRQTFLDAAQVAVDELESEGLLPTLEVHPGSER